MVEGTGTGKTSEDAMCSTASHDRVVEFLLRLVTRNRCYLSTAEKTIQWNRIILHLLLLRIVWI